MSMFGMVVRGVIVAISLLLSFLLIMYRSVKNKSRRKGSALVLVLGDIGRSPRMMYHAHSFSRHEYHTTLVGYTDTAPTPALLKSPFVHIKGIANPPKPLLKLPWIARAPIRVVWQILSVLKICFMDSEYHCEFMVVQNPPSIPTLALARLIGHVAGTKVIIDWHNTGYSILAMRTGETSPLCKAAKWFEGYFGHNAYAHLFVTHALKDYLVGMWHLEGKYFVLHDRPPAHFRRTAPMVRRDLVHRLLPLLKPPLPPFLASSVLTAASITPASISSNHLDTFALRNALIVSSTSWTADEDFTPLLTALDMYHEATTTRSDLPEIAVVITGRGELRKSFQEKVAAKEKVWTKICVRCVFLSAADYPALLGSADLGISMHTSSSGRDLPMKVVDMFGSGTPVLAKEFPAIGELVKPGKNGETWNTAEELGQLMIDLMKDFPQNKRLNELKEYLTRNQPDSGGNHVRVGADEEWLNWDQNWDRVVYQGLIRSRSI